MRLVVEIQAVVDQLLDVEVVEAVERPAAARTAVAPISAAVFSAMLPAGSTGLVAVPVRIADAASAALVTAGDRVDVLAAVSAAGGPPYAQVVAPEAQVLAVPTAVQDGGDGALIVVAASPAVAARLAAAAVTSRLSLTLRPRG